MRIKIRKPIDIESQPLPKLPKEPREPTEFKEPKLPMSNKIMYCIIFITCLLSIRIVINIFSPQPHTIKKLKCQQHQRKLTCSGAAAVGTFVLEIPKKCSGSVYDVGGFPFSAAKHGDVFKVPAKKLYVKNLNGNCDVKAYIDSAPLQLHYPFTWITTNQHTVFTVMDGGKVLVDSVSATLFDSTARGPWIAYTYDIPGTSATVIGDGTDIIHIYDGVS
jgi:hypothetical protein